MSNYSNNQDPGNSKNLIMAMVLSMAVLFGFQYFYDKPRQEQLPNKEETAAPKPSATAPAAPLVAPKPQTRQEALLATKRIAIETPKLKGSINLTGARFDDLVLTKYRETIDPNSDPIVLFAPKNTEKSYYAEHGYVSSTGAELPTENTTWSSSSTKLTPDAPVTLSWTNKSGIRFERIISVDKEYLFTIKDRVINGSSSVLTLHQYGLVAQRHVENKDSTFVIHEGALGVFNGTLEEVTIADLKKKGGKEYKTRKGWLGLTDKYFLAALVPSQNQDLTTRFSDTQTTPNFDKAQVDYLSPAYTVASRETLENTHHLFAGAKIVTLLDQYEKQLALPNFDRAVDFGWFYFITKPTYYLLEWLHGIFNNFGLCILLLTILFKLALFPLANKSYKSMSRMKALQPKMEAIKERHGDDKIKMNQEMMELYKREKVNPMSGCLPMLVQAPILFALYKVLYISIEMRHAPFFGWIKDLSAPDPTSVINLFGLLPFSSPEFLHIGIWPILLGLTMYFQQKLNPPPADPAQAKMFMLMPVLFSFMLAGFPVGLVIYWVWSNLLSILQQWVIMRKHG